MAQSLQKLSKALIRDGIGKQVPALDLFAHVIRYLKNHMLSALDTKGIKVYNKEIHWVLPVPAKWKKSGKQFMREAANKVKVKKHTIHLSIYITLACHVYSSGNTNSETNI